MRYCYKIKECRKKLNLTQEELAALSGVPRTVISGLEKGDINIIKTITLINIANALNATVSEIFLQE